MKRDILDSGFVLFTSLSLAMTIASPVPIHADIPSFGHSKDAAEQQSGNSWVQYRLTARLQQGPDNGSGYERPPIHSEALKRAPDNVGGKSPEPNPEPRPSYPPQPGGPVTGNPRGPGSSHPRPTRPVRPPGNSSPRPPIFHYPPFGPRPGYVWGGGNGWRLHQYFLGDRQVRDRAHRHHFYPGAYLPTRFLSDIAPIPPALMVYLPPVPWGYDIGYYDGYCILYNAVTLRIVSVLDLYRY